MLTITPKIKPKQPLKRVVVPLGYMNIQQQSIFLCFVNRITAVIVCILKLSEFKNMIKAPLIM